MLYRVILAGVTQISLHCKTLVSPAAYGSVQEVYLYVFKNKCNSSGIATFLLGSPFSLSDVMVLLRGEISSSAMLGPSFCFKKPHGFLKGVTIFYRSPVNVYLR